METVVGGLGKVDIIDDPDCFMCDFEEAHRMFLVNNEAWPLCTDCSEKMAEFGGF